MALVDEVKRRAARARFEAERVVRLNRAQARIASTQEQLSASVARLGYLTYDLAGRGEITHPQVTALCESMNQLKAEVTRLQADIRAIQTEQFVEAQPLPKCAFCGAVIPLEARFCRRCGRPATAESAAPPIVPRATPTGLICSACGTVSPGDMRYCLHCGQPLAGVPQSPPARVPASAPGIAETHGSEPAAGPPTVLVAFPPPPICGEPASEQLTASRDAPADAALDEQPGPAEAAAAPRCGACGEPIAPDASFCVGCGRQISRDSAPGA